MQAAILLKGQSSSPSAANGNSEAPRMAGVSGSQAGQSGDGVLSDSDKAQFVVGQSVQNDVSPPLSKIPLGTVEPWTTPREMPERDVLTKEPPARQISDSVLQSTFGLGQLAPLAMPAPSKNFAGLTNRNGVYPPDTNGDVGPNHYVQWVNLSLQIWDKNGNSLYGPTNGNTIWSGFGGACQTQNAGDPIVLYDSIADRWLISQFTSANPYGECIAISSTPDPTGTWNRYFFQFSTTVFYDYPHLGVWPDGYYMGANRFTGNTYNGGSAIVFNRANMLAGQPATFQQFNLSSTYGTPFPSDLDGATLPPAGSTNYFAAKGTNSLRFWRFHVDWANSANSTFTGPVTVATAAYNDLCATTRSCVPQPSTTVGLDGLGDRLMHRLAYRNFGTHESLVVNHSVNAASSGTQAGVRWYEIRNPVSPTIYQQGTYAPDATNRWMGSVAMDGQGNLALAYSVSSSTVSPGIRYTGRLVTDPLGTLPQGEATLINGSGSQTGTGSRWGDYAMTTIDPTDDCTFWFTTEYMATTGTASWVTRIGAFKFPGCGGAPPTNTPVPPPTNTPNPVATNTPIPPPTNTPVPPTATNTPVPGGCTQQLANPGFESGTAPWGQSSTNGYQLIDTTRPHTGSFSAYLGGYNSGTDTIYQTVSIPANATSSNLSFWWYMTSAEGTTTAYDFLYAEVRSTTGTLLGTLQTQSNRSTRNAWVQSTNLNLLPWKGQTVRVQWRATTDSSLVSSFFVDDVSLNTCQ
jgi:hypothetical protein